MAGHITNETDLAISLLKDGAEEVNGVFDALTIVKFKDTDIADIKYTKHREEIYTANEDMMEDFANLAENEIPPYANLLEGFKISVIPQRKGLRLGVSQTVRMDKMDDTMSVKEFIAEQEEMLVLKGMRTLTKEIINGYTNAFTSFLAPDGVALCGQHVTKAGVNWFNNRLTGNPKLTEASIEQLDTYGSELTAPSGDQMPIDFDAVIVRKNSPNAKMARKLFDCTIAPTKIGDINIYEGEKQVIEHPYLPKDSWFAFNKELGNPITMLVRKKPIIDSEFILKTSALGIDYPATTYIKAFVKTMPFAFAGSDGSES